MTDFEYRQSTRDSHLRQTDPEASDAINRSLTGGSHFSHASASTKSWVYSTQQNPPLPPPVDPSLDTSPIRRSRPLPDPQLHPQRFHAVNPTEELEDEEDEEDEEHMNIEPNVQGVEFGYLHGLGKAHQLDQFASSSYTGSGEGREKGGKSFVGGFFRGIRRLPQKMLRSKGSTEKRRFFGRRPFGTEGSDSVTGMTTGNTLPPYASNQSTPIGGPPNVQYVQAMDMPEPMAPSTEVLAPSFTPGLPIPRARHPSFRVTPPSESIAAEENPQLYEDDPQHRPQGYDQQYERNPQVYEDRPLEPSNYVEEDDSTVRPPGTGRIPTVMMYQDSQGPHYDDPPPPPMIVRSHSPSRSLPHVPTPARSPARTPSRTPAHTPARSPAQPLPLNLIPSRRQTVQTVQTQDTDPNILSSPNVLSSPSIGTGHPPHARDYRKMPFSPTPTSRNTVATSYYDPSFSSLTPMERFFKTLYNLPWVAHERVTIDYRPGDSRAKRDGRYRGKKPMSSWYRSVMAKKAGTTADLDLLDNGYDSMRTSGTTNMRTSGTTAGSPMSPVSAGRSSKRTSGGHNRHHRDHKKSQSHRRRKHRRPTSTSTEGDQHHPRSNSPIIPTAYPYTYPSYPYFPPYMPPPPLPPLPTQSQSQGHRSPRGPRSHRQATYPPAGYVQYQPMHAPPGGPQMYAPPGQQGMYAPPGQQQVYVLQSSPTLTQTSVEGQQQQQGQILQPQHSQILQPVYMQVLPGGFSPDTTQSASPPLRPRTPPARSRTPPVRSRTPPVRPRTPSAKAG